MAAVEPAMRETFPVLSLAERNRRYWLLRAFCEQRDLTGLLFFGYGRHQWDQYVTNEGAGGIALFPLHASPLGLVGSANVTLGRLDIPGAAYERWTEQEITSPGYGVAEAMHDRGMGRGRVGVVGISSRFHVEKDGVVPYRQWMRLVESLPDVVFVDVSVDFEDLAMVHSDEEIELIRKSAELGERATEAMLAAAGPARREAEVIGAGYGAIIAGGGYAKLGPMRAGPERTGWTAGDWVRMGGGSWRLAAGDMVGAELFTFYAGFETQQQVDISIGPPDAGLAYLSDVAIESYQAGLQILRPGLDFRDLCEAMEAPLRKRGLWNMGPVVQTVSPLGFNSATHVGLDLQPGLGLRPDQIPASTPRDGDFAIQPGTAFAFEPAVLQDKRRVCIGGTVICTPDGYEELNSLCNTILIAD